MDDPLQYLRDSFKDEWRTRFSAERPDGGLVLTLYDERGAVVRRALTGRQLGDEREVRRLVRSIRFGLAIDRGQGLACLIELARPAANEPLPGA